MPPANHYINPLVTGILRPAIPNTAIITASSIGSSTARDSSCEAQADRWPTPRPAEAQSKDDLLFDPIAHSAPPFIVVRVSHSPAAAELSGTILTSSSSGKKIHEGSKENEKQAVPSTPTRPTTMAERKPYDGGGIVPPHIRTAIAESKNTSTEAAPAKAPETKPAAKDISAEEFTRSGFVPAYVLKNIATSEASTAEQRADAQGTLDLDTARRERGKDAEGQGEK